MKNVDHERAIIGGCPAGITAGLYATLYGDVCPKSFCNQGFQEYAVAQDCDRDQ